jgi:multiple sugar transport system permease protein
MKLFKKNFLPDLLAYSVLIILAIFCLVPFIWQLSTSFKTMPDIMQNSTKLLPEKFILDNYRIVLTTVGFPRYLLNSLIVSMTSMVISMILSCICAYSIVRFFPKIAENVTRLLITAYMFPTILLVTPYFILASAIGLSNSLFGLTVVYMSFTIPYCTWMLTGYFYSVPDEIEEAAKIDGATKFKTFYRISLPLIAPGMVATAIFAFINTWNEFLYSLVLISSGTKKTVSVALYSLIGGETLRYGEMMAASVLVILPSMILFFIIQKRLVGGLTGGAIK